MSGPSALHEERVAVLADLADLAGFVRAAQLDTRLRPDVVRLHHRRPAIFVADAKATETAGCIETKARLLAYLGAAHTWLRAGFEVYLFICHGAEQARDWRATVHGLADVAGLEITGAGSTQIDVDTLVTAVVITLGVA